MTKKKKNFLQTGERALRLHKKYRGKFSVASKVPVDSFDDLSLVYTPGVGYVSSYVAAHKKTVRQYTMKGNSVAVVSDGSAVLGLGNIGPEGALPVMEGKCLLFKKFAGIDAVPIVLDTQDSEEIIKIVKAIAPGFGGINLEDISAPRCFEIESRLKKELHIPVMHDDQHGTAIIILAGLLNALKVSRKKLATARIVIAGAGAAGTAIAKLIRLDGARNIAVTDRHGVIRKDRKGLSPQKRELALLTQPGQRIRTLEEAMRGADVFIGVSGPGVVTKEMISSMAPRAIVFALANPVPEIMPDEAREAGALVIATGRSDFPNQLNNSQVFPGVFRGALDNGVAQITDTMKLRAAHAIARLVPRPHPAHIVPGIFDSRLVPAVAASIRERC